MERKQKIKELLGKLEFLKTRSKDSFKSTGNITSLVDGLISEEVEELRKSVKDRPVIRAIEEMGKEVDLLRSSFDVEGILKAVQEADEENETRLSELSNGFLSQLEGLRAELSDARTKDGETSLSRIKSVLERFAAYEGTFDAEKARIATSEALVQGEMSRISKAISKIEEQLSLPPQEDGTKQTLIEATEKAQMTAEDAKKEVKELERTVNARLSRIQQQGGGNANRDLTLNSSVFLTKYTDINFIPGSNMGIVAASNDATNRTDLTFYSTGGGGGGASVAGADQQVQYNDGGVLGASSIFTWNKNTSVLSVGVGHFEGHAIHGDASDGFFITTKVGANLVGFGAGNAGNVTFYVPTTFSSIVSINASASVRGALAIGQQGSVLGAVDFHGRTSGTMRVQAASTAGGYTLTLPANDGNAGQYLLTDGNGITQWASVTAAGGSGITRSVSVLSVSSTVAAAASTDYVLFANVGINLTLPTAIGNTNQYIIKNTAASSVLVTAPAGEDIDGSATALLDTQYTALSFISNGSVWGVLP